MNTNLQEREFDGVVAEGAGNLEVSRVIKAWLDEQQTIRPFRVGWPIQRRLEAELSDVGFTNITMSKLEPHGVYVIRGQSRNAACRSVEDLRRIFKKLGREIGFPFRAADTALSFARGRFQVALVLPDGSTAPEIVFGPEYNEADEI